MTKIAILEDDEGLAEIYQVSLKAEGFKVIHAIDGVAGVELVKTHTPDLVLLDIMMPQMSGDEVLRAMRESDWGKNTPVIVLTNIAESELSDEFRKLNYQGYLVKAMNSPSQIIDNVKRVLAGQPVQHPLK